MTNRLKKPLGLLTVVVLLSILYTCREAEAADYNYSICWTPPTQRSDGSPLTNLAKYEIYRGACGTPLSKVKTVIVPATCTQVLSPISSYCWAVTAVDAAGIPSVLSAIQTFHTTMDTDTDGVPDYLDNCKLHPNVGQVDSDADGFGNHCDGDMNGDGETNSFDTPLFRAQIAKPSIPPIYNPADLNVNGYVNSFDTAIYRSLLGKPPGPKGP